MVDGLQKVSSNRLLVMQGRLTPPLGSLIQSFPKNNWEVEFEIVKTLGLHGIEWTIDLTDFDSHPLLVDSYAQNKYISSDNSKFITCDFFMQIDIFKNTEYRINLVEEFLVKLISSKNVGNNSTLVVPLVDSGKPITYADWNSITKMFLKLTPLLKEVGSRILFELSTNPKNQFEFISNFSADNFGINYDIGNSASLGWDPKIEIEVLKSVIKHIHIKDRKLNGSTVPLGQGSANFTQISQSLKQISYKGNYTLQCARISGQNEIQTIQEYVDFLKNVGLI